MALTEMKNNVAVATHQHHFDWVKDALNKLIPLMVRQTHHERNQLFTVRPEPVEGLNQGFLKRLGVAFAGWACSENCLCAWLVNCWLRLRHSQR